MIENRLTFREVQHGSPEYWATVELRDVVLRKPLGLQFSREELAAEGESHHLAGYRDQRLIACLVLRPLAQGEIRMRQVAVAAQWQARGIGRALVEFSETVARRLGFERMTLHARDTAVPFYEKLGYVRVGEPFEEVTVVHWAMEKRLSA